FTGSVSLRAFIGAITEDEYYDYVAIMLDAEAHRADLPVIIFGQSQINPQILKILKILRTQNYRIGLISNALPGLQLLLEALEVTSLFDIIVNSSEVKLAKPDPRIYKLALEKLSLQAEECLFIDDQPINVQAAQKLGFHALHYVDPAHLIWWLHQHGIEIPEECEGEDQVGAGFRGDDLSPWTTDSR
ncbi:MAG: HAD family hydrolase, partial [Candidatus Hodarchaeota archaeon]